MTSNKVRTPFRLILAAGLVALVGMSSVGLGAPAQAKRISPKFFGMHDGRVGAGVLTDSVPFGAVRVWDAGTSWRDVERRKGRFDLSALERAVLTSAQRGVRPLIVLGQTPRFHAVHPHAPGAYGRGASSMPRLRPWKRYVAVIARTFGTSVDYQVWNEPNVVNYWTGSPAQMALLTATASRTIERVAGRAATVVAPSFPLRLAGQQRWFRAYWTSRVYGRSVARFVDVVSANLYPPADQAPEAAMDLARFAKRALPTVARRKPLWNTEINYGLLGGAPAKRIPAWRQAAYVSRTLVLNAAGPVNRFYWYAWGIGPIANTHLANDSGSRLTRAGRAWELTRSWLIGTRSAGCSVSSAGVYTCVFRKGRGDVRRIYWKPRGKTVSVRTPRSTRSSSDLTGVTTTRRGAVRLDIGQVPVLVVSRR